jgi:hypothetical protein
MVGKFITLSFVAAITALVASGPAGAAEKAASTGRHTTRPYFYGSQVAYTVAEVG